MKEVIDLAAAGTEMDAIKWYNDAYKRFADLSVALGSQDPGVKVDVQQPSQSGGTMTVITYYKAGPRQDGAASSLKHFSRCQACRTPIPSSRWISRSAGYPMPLATGGLTVPRLSKPSPPTAQKK